MLVDLFLYAGLVIGVVGLLALIKPRLLRLRRRWMALVPMALAGGLSLAGLTRSDDGSRHGAPTMLIDRFMPQFQVSEVHAIRIHAPADRIFDAIRHVTFDELGPAPVLAWVRGLPARISGHRRPRSNARRPFFEPSRDGGFVLLGEVPNREMVWGLAGQFWKLRGGEQVRLSSPEEFAALERSGLATATINFYVEETGSGWCRLSTETRVVTTDAASRRTFGRYWFVIYPGSAYIRRAVLKAVRRRAERAADAAGP